MAAVSPVRASQSTVATTTRPKLDTNIPFRNQSQLKSSNRTSRLLPFGAKRGPEETVDLLRLIWSTLVHEAERYRRLANEGRPFFKDLLEAYEIILSVNQTKDFKTIKNTMLAMGYLYESNPKRFADETAFAFQCARRLRAVSDCSFASRWDQRSGKVEKVYRDISPKSLRAL